MQEMEPTQRNAEYEEGPATGAVFDLARWMALIRRRRLLIISVVGIAVAVAIVSYVITPPQYRAMCLIQVAPVA